MKDSLNSILAYLQDQREKKAQERDEAVKQCLEIEGLISKTQELLDASNKPSKFLRKKKDSEGKNPVTTETASTGKEIEFEL